MTQAAAQAAAFFREVATGASVWTVRDERGFPAPLTPQGQRSRPFWSSLRRVEKIVTNVPAFADFKPFEVPLSEFRERWLPGCERDGFLVGLNWTGRGALGYDIAAAEVASRLDQLLDVPGD